MENRRFFLICVVGVILFFIYQAWKEDHAEPSSIITEQTPQTDVSDVAAPPAQSGDVPSIEGPADSTPTVKPAGNARVRIDTDVYRGEISLAGGDLHRLELKAYAAVKQREDIPVSLLDDRGDRLFVVQSGLLGQGEALVSQYTDYQAPQTEYALSKGQDQVDVRLEASPAPGVTVTKIYHFQRGSYEIGLSQKVVNAGTQALQLSPYVQLHRTEFKLGEEPPFVRTFSGYGIYEQKAGSNDYRFRKTAMKDIAEEPIELKQTGGWLAMMQHYFLTAVIPPEKEELRFIARPSKTRGYLGQYIGAYHVVPAGGEQVFESKLYAGPTLQHGLASSDDADAGFFALDGLENVAPGLELTVDYGLLTPISEPLFWILQKFHALTGNWGVAIILLTLLVKGAMFKLSEAQYRSMAKMRKFAPKIQDIKERYGDDRERQQKAMMDLYKKEGFNPLGGCWPMLVQFPVFISLYWVLLQSVELRQADFMLWINDLSAKDPYYVLPVLFGISMWAQQKLSGNAMTMDPMQKRIMSAMPIAMGAFFTLFPAGLVLYWFFSNLVSITQQWLINRKLDKEGLGKASN